MGIRNTVIEIDLLKNIVNSVLFEPDWLNMLVEGDENKVTSFQLTK